MSSFLQFGRRDNYLPLNTNLNLRRSYRPEVPESERPKAGKSRRRGGQREIQKQFAPPEDWHEPSSPKSICRIILQEPGPGYRYTVTPKEVENRIKELPPSLLPLVKERLDVIQFSRMTKKKQLLPCYGLQWGSSIYIYPLEYSPESEKFQEYYDRKPDRHVITEARRYGGIVKCYAPDSYAIVWSQKAARDFYLENILLHELGHLIDERNSSYRDRENFADQFALTHGRPARSYLERRVYKRHHGK